MRYANLQNSQAAPMPIFEPKTPEKFLACISTRFWLTPFLLIFSSDGKVFLRQNLKANTLPERISSFPTPLEFGEFFHPQAMALHGTLRDYQRVAVSQVLGAVQAGRRRMYLQMATGTGKTITAAIKKGHHLSRCRSRLVPKGKCHPLQMGPSCLTRFRGNNNSQGFPRILYQQQPHRFLLHQGKWLRFW
mgnify:CR=1 FL=1